MNSSLHLNTNALKLRNNQIQPVNIEHNTANSLQILNPQQIPLSQDQQQTKPPIFNFMAEETKKTVQRKSMTISAKETEDTEYEEMQEVQTLHWDWFLRVPEFERP